MKNLKIFTENIEYEAREQIDLLLAQEPFKECKVRVMPDCLSEDTEVLTDSGFKPIIELCEEDNIANYDYDTKKIIFSKPKSIIVRPKRINEKIYNFNNSLKGIDITVSENHRMGLRTEKEIIAKNCNDLKIKDIIYNGDGLEKTNILYTDNEIRLIAWIVGDGYLKVVHNKRSDNYRISFGLKKERKINRILTLLKEENITPYTSNTEKQFSIIINTKDSKRFLEILKYKKEFPIEFLKLNKRQAEIFLQELIQVDGDYENYIKNNSYRLNSKNKRDLDIIAGIISINFGKATIKKRLVKGYKTTYIYYLNFVKEEKILFNKSGYGSNKIEKVEIEYNKNLVCVECDTSFFICRQNGTTFVTGNCHAGAGCVIGFTADLGDKVIPNIVGVDIGCGMLCVELGKIELDLEKLDNIIREKIPAGKEVRKSKLINFDKIKELYCFRELKNSERFNMALGTLGGGWL